MQDCVTAAHYNPAGDLQLGQHEALQAQLVNGVTEATGSNYGGREPLPTTAANDNDQQIPNPDTYSTLDGPSDGDGDGAG